MIHAICLISTAIFAVFLCWLESSIRDNNDCKRCDGDGFVHAYTGSEDEPRVKICQHCEGSGIER